MRVMSRQRLAPGKVSSLIVTLTLGFALFGCEPNEDTEPEISETLRSAEVEALAAGSGAHKLVDPQVQEPDLMESLQRARSWTGDLDGMEERRVIRVLVVPNRTNYFLDGAVQRGVTYESMVEFEKFLNKRLKRGKKKVHVVILPVTRDLLTPALIGGYGDLVAANLTDTEERRRVVDFSKPFLSDVRELVVTGPAAPTILSLDDLSGQEVWVRTSSSFHESLVDLNNRLGAEGKSPVVIRAADEHLETEDLLEMVNAGIIGITIADNHIAEFWSQVFDEITVHDDLAVRTGGQIAWMFRKDSPQLAREVNAFTAKFKKGTLMGNVLFTRYLKDTKWVRNAGSGKELKRFDRTVDLFRKYSEQYDFDYLMMIAQGYQESRLDQSVRSSAGAIGIMQLLPSTAAEPAVGIRNIEKAEPNVHAGIKYMRWIVDTYFADEELDELQQTLFAFASYNAGPNRIRRLRRKAQSRGLDPDIWFDNVELMAAEEIGRETLQYVSNIYKYYLAYKLIAEQRARREQAIEKTTQ
ncbi:MAG: transporter substrate-binding domain-containing protein [Betaproteobacteria bacterium]|nr:MAG: transporter substrate-binding domain-containing protein [Betaproteobacteria bacterium]